MNRSSYTSLAEGSAASSPKLTGTDRKKKQGLFGTKKAKPTTLERPKASSSTSLVTSPLPVSTPSKAAKFFGLEAKSSVAESPRRLQHQDDAASDDGAPVRPALKKQYSRPLLTRFKIGADRQSKFKEEDVEPDERPETSKPSATKGLRMLIPEFAGPKRSPIEQTKAAATRFDLDEEDEDVGYASDSHHEVRFRIPAASRPVRTSSKSKAMRRKPLSIKDFPRMSPITEASFESLRPAYREAEDVTELGVISEYEYENPPHSVPMLPRSQTETILPPQDKYELDEADLSPTDEYYEEDATDEEEGVVHPGTKVNLKRVHWQQATAVHFRSPLQIAEDAWLDEMEEDMPLEARRVMMRRVEAEKQAIDNDISELRRKHELFKLEFASSCTAKTTHAEPEPIPDEMNEEDDADLVSLCSSIDLDEEPTVHEAKLMTFTRITPGMVKLVDIPPRKKQPVAYVGSKILVPHKLALVEHQKKSATASLRSENVPPSSVSTHC
jgi:hypothetical protein